MSNNVPTHETHQPIKVLVPEDDDVMVERGAMPTPSLWQPGVQVTHKATRRAGVVRLVDWKTNQFRLVGEPRTQWQACQDWDVLVEPTPQERAKDVARATLQAEIEALDADVLPLVEVLCDHDDPEKALAKLRAMQKLGMLGRKVPEPTPETADVIQTSAGHRYVSVHTFDGHTISEATLGNTAVSGEKLLAKRRTRKPKATP